MKRLALLACALSLFLSGPAGGEDIKRAAYAGQFYKGDAAGLAAEVDGFLARVRPGPEAGGRLRALIAPHAGYVYSGLTAAHAYALIKGAAIETVVIVGPSHRTGFHGCSIYPRGGFETPLGVARIDDGLAAALAKASGFGFIPGAFAEEHSVEVQIPFIQRVLPRARIVPVLMGYQTRKTIRTLADALAGTCGGDGVLVVASTDLSHFLTRENAAATDDRTASLIRALRTDALMRQVEAAENILCGGGPVLAVLLCAEKAGKARVEILHRSDSSALAGPERVVGYMAAAVYSGEPGRTEDFRLSPQEKKELLRLARASMTAVVSGGSLPEYATGSPNLRSARGAFVTLRKRGELRGCIGFLEPEASLYQTVVRAAVFAATRDVRFPPVGEAELASLDIEISVLTPLREISDPRSVRVGKHGLVIEKDGRSGLLLPQVPVENGWDRRTFLEQACRKAGLPRDAWRNGAKVLVFEAIVFGE